MSSEETQKLRIGNWGTFRAAGTEAISRDCVRTAIRYDADGFTIEEPENETIVEPEPYRVRSLTGHVHLSDTPLEGVNVEVLAAGTKHVVRTTTNADGEFTLPSSHKGSYKFKVTKDGFKSLTGTIIVAPTASENSLSFELSVGT